MKLLPYAFRIVGACTEPRRLVDAAAAFGAFAACDERAQVEREGYLSAFQFGADFRDYLEANGTPKGFSGPCWSPFLWFDLDREDDLDAALADARRLAGFLVERYGLDDDALPIFFSGSKGFHVGLPTSLWAPMPSVSFHVACRRLAEGLADKVGVRIDTGVYDRVRAFRAPNSRHPKTGLHKRRLTFDELMGLSLPAILEMAKTPAPFDVPTPPDECEQAKLDWAGAMSRALDEGEVKTKRREDGTGWLNRATLEFVRDGAAAGERHARLFSAAANLAEFSCSPSLAHALLIEAALDSGLSPSEARRQIDCGLAHVGPPAAVATSTEPQPIVAPIPSPGLQNRLAELWRSTPEPVPPIIQAAQDVLGAVILDDGANAPGPYDANGGRR